VNKSIKKKFWKKKQEKEKKKKSHPRDREARSAAVPPGGEKLKPDKEALGAY